MKRKQRLNSIDDIAKLAGVSKSTVSRALNDSRLISTETKERIAAIAKEYDFRPSVAARALSMRSSKTIAYVIDAYDDDCGLESPFSLEILGGASTGLRECGYDMLIAQVNEKRGDWASEYLGSGRVDGFILMTYENKHSHIERLLELDAPFSVWGSCDSRDCCSVGSDNHAGGALAANHLLSTGKKSFAFVGGPQDDTEVRDRRRGFFEALGRGGINPDNVIASYGDFSEESGRVCMNGLLDKQAKFDAAFVAGDLMAIGAMRALVSRGLRVPDDVAVIGYDDLYVSGFTTPALTTISQHIADSGRLLARNLVARIENGIVESVTIPVDLIKRHSA